MKSGFFSVSVRCSLFLILYFLLSFSNLYAETFNVCIFPENTEIENEIKEKYKTIDKTMPWVASLKVRTDNKNYYTLLSNLSDAWKTEDETKIKAAVEKLNNPEKTAFKDNDIGVSIVKFQSDYKLTETDLEDLNLLKYICDSADADLLIVPQSRVIDNYILRTVDIWSPFTGKTERIHIDLVQYGESFSNDYLDSLAGIFNTGTDSDAEKKTKTEDSFLDALTLTSVIPATISVQGTEYGVTPITLHNLKTPLFVTAGAEGYAGLNLNVDGSFTSKQIELKPLWMDDSSFYSNNKRKFYTGMALSLGAFGLNLVSGAVNTENKMLEYSLKMVSGCALMISIVNLTGCLFDYFTSADYVSQ